MKIEEVDQNKIKWYNVFDVIYGRQKELYYTIEHTNNIQLYLIIARDRLFLFVITGLMCVLKRPI